MTKTSRLFPLPGSPQNLPVFKPLPLSQSETILVRNDVGRIAFVVDGRVQLLPVNYVFLNGWIYGRTAAPAYLPKNAAVTFEVEEHTEKREWRSVVVHGQLDMVEPGGAETKRGISGRAWSSIRRLIASPPVNEAPAVLFHDQLFCIRAVDVSGRVSLPVEGRFFAS